MKKVSNEITYLTMEILQEESWQPTAAPWHAESSLASKNYRRQMTGMFKVNKMEGVLLTKSKQGFGGFLSSFHAQAFCNQLLPRKPAVLAF